MKMITLSRVRKELHQHASPAKASVLKGFFKTGPGQYGEGDIFIGVKVPEMRRIALACGDISLKAALRLLRSPVHEERLLALLILTRRYHDGTAASKRTIIGLYLRHTAHVNNWDLVDLTAAQLLGDWLRDKDRRILRKLARSANMWERRIAIVATHAFIREGECADALHIADMLLHDKEDLIHKAVGWMLREAGKRDIRALKGFLGSRSGRMPRTMLRYAIERFPEKERQAYLQK